MTIQYGIPIPELNFDKECKHCSRSTGNAICGSIHNGDLTRVKLVVISDYPGHYEEQKGYSFYDNQPDIIEDRKAKKKAVRFPNAGNYIRRKLEDLGLDSYSEVYCTNVLKCKQNSEASPKEAEIKKCVGRWLLPELLLIETINPSVPIMLLGKYAFLVFKKYIPNSPFVSTDSLKDKRRKVYFYLNHPLIVTVNPANVCGSSKPRLERQEVSRRSDLRSVRDLTPQIGSPDWIYTQDLNLLKEYL